MKAKKTAFTVKKIVLPFILKPFTQRLKIAGLTPNLNKVFLKSLMELLTDELCFMGFYFVWQINVLLFRTEKLFLRKF